jgi:hypothetical protein
VQSLKAKFLLARETHKVELVSMIEPTIDPKESVSLQRSRGPAHPGSNLLRQQQTRGAKCGKAQTESNREQDEQYRANANS